MAIFYEKTEILLWNIKNSSAPAAVSLAASHTSCYWHHHHRVPPSAEHPFLLYSIKYLGAVSQFLSLVLFPLGRPFQPPPSSVGFAFRPPSGTTTDSSSSSRPTQPSSDKSHISSADTVPLLSSQHRTRRRRRHPKGTTTSHFLIPLFSLTATPRFFCCQFSDTEY